MLTPRATVRYALAVLVLALGLDVQAQQDPSRAGAAAAADTDFEQIEEIIVRGRGFGDLRLEIRRTEEAVFSRFNDLNSDDAFDIACRTEKVYGMRARSCMPNFARDLQARSAKAAVLAMQGGPSPAAANLLYAAQARRLQADLDAEMRRLAETDEQLRDALEEFAEAQFALTLARGTATLSREVTAASGSLPYGAELMFEIIMGNEPWSHTLTRQTFTIADVVGEIRRLTIDCEQGRERMEFESGVEWTLPRGWSACTLQVNAKRESKFRLYEF